MLQAEQTRTNAGDDRDLISARSGVVVTTGVDSRSGQTTYYLKVTETDEIFELGEAEYQVWRQFEGGLSLAAAERATVARHGEGARRRFRALVAELALRGLLRGAVPPDLLREFAADPRTRQGRLAYQIDPGEREDDRWLYRFPLFNPNRVCSLLARWFWFMKYSVWPITFVAVLGGLVLVKHSTEVAADLPVTILSAYGIPHALVTLFTISLLRNIVMGSVIRHFGGAMRYFAIEFRYGFFPRFRADKRGMFRLRRTPQLWAHSSTIFVRLAFFGFGALGWWAFRGDGTMKSPLFLLAMQAGLIDMLVSALPIFKSETYYWFAAYFEDPFLRERAEATLRGVFTRRKNPLDLPPIERIALIAYGLCLIASALLIAYTLLHMLVAWTGRMRGAGLAVLLGIGVLVGFWALAMHKRKREREAMQARRRSRRRGGRAALAPLAED